MGKSFKYAAIYTFFSLFLVQSASAQQVHDVEALQLRMNSLESKVDALIGLMQKQQTGQKDIPTDNDGVLSGQAVASDAPDGYVRGVYLDVFAPASTRIYKERDDRPLPNGTPSASISISPTSRISYGEITKHEETKRFALTRAATLPPLVVSGYLKINYNGPHTLGLEITDNSSHGARCDAKLFLNSKLVTSKYVEGFETISSTINLSNGLYLFTIFFECDGGAPVEYHKKSITFVMAEPGDRAPKAVSPDLLFIKQ